VTRWSDATGGQGGHDYAARFDALAASGADVHGEAALCASLVPPGSRVLDAGCGTGRVAIRLAELGYDCTGTDLDASMLSVARERAPDVSWVESDLSTLDLLGAGHAPYDLVVLAGNVVPLVAPGTEPVVVARVAAHLRPGGLLVAGFGLDRGHLPPAAGLVDLADYDTWCRGAGLVPVRRLATWDGEPYDGGGYAVSIHRRPTAPPPSAAG
jgi:SAM-dependent methyltransferase